MLHFSFHVSMMRCSLALALIGWATSDVLDSSRPQVDLGQASGGRSPQVTLSSLLLAHLRIPTTPAVESVRRIAPNIRMMSQEDKGIVGLALDALWTSSKLQISKSQLAPVRELSENKKTIEESETMEDARRSQARELRKEKQAAETFVQEVDFDSALVIDTARTLVELQKAKVDLFTGRQLRSLQEGVDAITAGPKQILAEAQAKIDEATKPKE
jgi:hypothetical protein